MIKRTAFTLAEVLTTLLIIGAVSAILIPALNANVRKQKTEATLKRMYSDFTNNIQTVLSDANCTSISCLRKYGKVPNPTSHNGVFANPDFINIARKSPNCFYQSDVMPLGYNANNFSSYMLSDGTVIALYDFAGNCNTQREGLISVFEETYVEGEIAGQHFKRKQKYNPKNAPVCGMVVFDTNAAKAPNIPGKDRFAYYIVDEPIDNSYLVPIGYTTDDDKNSKSNYNANGLISSQIGSGECKNDARGSGYNCTAKIMLDGWKIKY